MHRADDESYDLAIELWTDPDSQSDSNATHRDDIVSRVEQVIRCYLTAPEAAYLPITLWFIATHLSEVFDAFPYLAFTSPVEGCGKTRGWTWRTYFAVVRG
jgi:hypothetical protein